MFVLLDVGVALFPMQRVGRSFACVSGALVGVTGTVYTCVMWILHFGALRIARLLHFMSKF